MKSFIFNIDKIQREYKDDKAIKTHYRPWQVVYVNVNEKGKGIQSFWMFKKFF